MEKTWYGTISYQIDRGGRYVDLKVYCSLFKKIGSRAGHPDSWTESFEDFEVLEVLVDDDFPSEVILTPDEEEEVYGLFKEAIMNGDL
jgi:hypothetical protein